MYATATMERDNSTTPIEDTPTSVGPIEVDNPSLLGKYLEITLAAGRPFWFREIEDKLIGFKTLEPNWNSYDAVPISDVLIDRATKILSNIDSENPPKPFVTPVPAGGINIEWNTSSLFLSIKVREEGDRYFIANRVSGKRDGNVFNIEKDSIDDLLIMLNR